MDYSPKEIELAFRYNVGDINDVQLNFLAVHNNIDEKRIREISKKLDGIEGLIKTFGTIILAFLVLGLIFTLRVIWI